MLPLAVSMTLISNDEATRNTVHGTPCLNSIGGSTVCDSHLNADEECTATRNTVGDNQRQYWGRGGLRGGDCRLYVTPTTALS